MVNGEKPLLFDSAQQNRLLREGVWFGWQLSCSSLGRRRGISEVVFI